jgi:hypothetical protein
MNTIAGIMLPDYQFENDGTDRVKIKFDPPVTKSNLGVPFAFQVLQHPSSEVKTTRFGRVTEVRCETAKWISFLKTSGVPMERIDDFKDSVGYVEPKPPAEEKVGEPAQAGTEKKAEPISGL